MVVSGRYRAVLWLIGWLIGLPGFGAWQTVAAVQVESPDRVDFSRDIRPILSDTCFKCHGPDEHSREAGLRLDARESVFDDSAVVVAGDSENSELFQRLISDDPDLLMPPAESGRHLSGEQIELFRRWIEQGAEWGPHWSLAAPVRPAVPQVAATDRPQNEIDHFVLRRLEPLQLDLAGEADRRTLARRVALDLTGLPPTPQQVTAFVADTRDNAYELLVDELLASPRYAEHMARYWLDVVRYGDTHGLHLDNYREHWPYRDWIIRAFQTNQPFDQFSIEQIAGDLLENPTRDQLVATGFNRSHVTTSEGGSIKEEVRVRNVKDRVSTFGTVYLGLTLGCASCHDHKFDPLSQREFYSLYAYFNSLDGNPLDGNVKDHAPVLMVGSEEQMAQLARLDQEIAGIGKTIADRVASLDYREPDDPPAVPPEPVEEFWIDDALPESEIRQGQWTVSTSEASQPVHQGQVSFVHEAEARQQYVIQKVGTPWELNEQDELFVHVFLDPENPPREIMLQWNNGNWEHRAIWGEDLIEWGQKGSVSRWFMGPLPQPGQWVRLAVPVDEVGLQAGDSINGVALTQYGGKVYWDSIGRISRPPPYPAGRSLRDWIEEQVEVKGAGLPEPLRKIINGQRETWTAARQRRLRDHFIEHVYLDARPGFQALHENRTQLQKQRGELKAKIPTTLIYRETKEPRDAFLLDRGEYDQPTDKLGRTVPAALPEIPAGQPNDRLALARWLFSADHPLAARVAVNRFWQQIFGTGIVESSEDFGAQGTFPSHPDLLDYLAVDFRKNGWDVKRLMKQMVMSATYRQQSAASPELIRNDPDNRWLARGSRYRLDAEILRDQALLVSGLLVEKIGGPSVKPPQPDGLWFAVGYSGSNTVRFQRDEGVEKVHRRSMYTFWKRTAPPPQMSTLDAPSREVCQVRRERTNTPLQALLLMNEPQYVEAARHLAERALLEPGPSTAERIDWMFRHCLCRPATEREREIFRSATEAFAGEFRQDTGAAKKLVAIGETPPDAGLDPVELATWTMAANLLMNMDEFITRN